MAGIHDGEVFVRLLTNRAACQLSLARPLSALKDCHMAVEVSHQLSAHFFCCTVSHGHLCTELEMSGCSRFVTSSPACSVLLSVSMSRSCMAATQHSTQLSSILYSVTSCNGCNSNCIITCSARLSSHPTAVFALVWCVAHDNGTSRLQLL